MKSYIGALAAVTFGVAMMQSCGSKSEEDTATVEITANTGKTDPVDYSNYTDAQIDSIAVYQLDFLSPGDGVGLLCHYYAKADAAYGTNKEQLKRKYKDIYDILKGIHGSALATAVEKVKRAKGIDLTQIYEEYAGMLATADDGGTFVQQEKLDSATLAQDVVPEGVTDAEVSHSDGFIIVSPTTSEEEE